MMTETPHLRFNRETRILFDLDGTVMRLLADPMRRFIVPNALKAFSLFQQAYPNQCIAATGRDYAQVIAPFGGKNPFFPCIMNDGTDLLLPDGTRHTYCFSKKEIEFIDYAKQQMRNFSEHHPHLITEVKDWSIGFHCAANHDYTDGRMACGALGDMVALSSHIASNLLNQLVDEAESSGLPFMRGGADATHSDFRHSKINKAESISYFAPHLPTLPQGNDWSNVYFCCDSLHGNGNDKKIAQMVRQKGGAVILVTNGLEERIPREGSKAEPHFAVNTPEELGDVLLHHTKRMLIEARHPLAKQFKNPSPK